MDAFLQIQTPLYHDTLPWRQIRSFLFVILKKKMPPCVTQEICFFFPNCTISPAVPVLGLAKVWFGINIFALWSFHSFQTHGSLPKLHMEPRQQHCECLYQHHLSKNKDIWINHQSVMWLVLIFLTFPVSFVHFAQVSPSSFLPLRGLF